MKSREALIKRMLRANSEEEREAAQIAADEWLKEYPNDLRVRSAQESLDHRSSKSSPPEGPLSTLFFYVFSVMLIVVSSLTFLFTGDLNRAVAAGIATSLATSTGIWYVSYFRYVNVPWHWFDRNR